MAKVYDSDYRVSTFQNRPHPACGCDECQSAEYSATGYDANGCRVWLRGFESHLDAFNASVDSLSNAIEAGVQHPSEPAGISREHWGNACNPATGRPEGVVGIDRMPRTI